ncbi:MAG: hypothetical protein QOJ57_1856, partial [Thermoleophilaceae bacterium]|nr:hypothetical protein [Thermoleophilaceae bacterium]
MQTDDHPITLGPLLPAARDAAGGR